MRRQTRRQGWRWAALLLALFATLPDVGLAAGTLTVGVLALRGDEHAVRRWQPTIDYLERQLGDIGVRLVPLDFAGIEPAVRDQQIDFVLANPSYYVKFEREYGASRIATLRTRSSRGPQSEFGSVVLRAATRTELNTFADLRGRRVAAVDPRSLGGFLMVAGAMLDEGMDIRRMVKELVWMHTHDNVVHAVLSGAVDAGIVRSDTVETLVAEGRITLAEVGIVNPRRGGSFPFLRSTGLYPEWPMAALAHVDVAVRDRVALALLQMVPDDPAAVAGGHLGWAIPRNYQPVHQLLRQLRQPPYDQPVSLRAVAREYRSELALIAVLMLAVLVYLVLLRRHNAALLAARAEARRAHDIEHETQQRLTSVAGDLGRSEHRFHKLADTTSDGIILLDPDGLVMFANRAAGDILGYAQDELRGRALHDLVVPEELRAQANAGFATFTKTGAGPVLDRRIEITARHRAGHLISVELAVSGIEDQSLRYAIGIFRDITERQRTLRALKESRANFRNIVDKNRTGILLTDGEGRVVFSNPAAAAMLGREEGDLVDVLFGIPSTPNVRQEMSIVRRGQPPGVAETLFTETEWNGKPAYLVMLHDVTGYREAQRRINDLAFNDSLTQLANRHHLIEELRRTILRKARAKSSFALLFLDLDKFKDVNDTLGHAIGDELLIETASRLKAGLRTSDFVARMGGDEFTVILDDIHGPEDVETVARKIAEQINQPFHLGDQELFVSASIGCSLYPDHSTEQSELLKQADTAMYRAKRQGLGFACYSLSMGDMVARGAQLDQELHGALQRGEFEVHYQVQVDLRHRQPIAYEALLRWNRPVGEPIGPAEFVPALENNGLIVAVGRWVLEAACRQIRAWLDEHGTQTLPVAVNLSPLQLERDQVFTFIAGLLEQYHVPPELLVIEITESTVLASSDQVMPQLHALRRHGVQLHLDDFGTGYSALSMLKRLPFSVVKIDRTFIRDLGQKNDEGGLGLTRAAIAMTQGLGMKALAEGIEDEAQLAILRDLGCNYGQGYLFGKPQPGSAITVARSTPASEAAEPADVHG